MIRDDRVRQLQLQLNDIAKQLSALQRVDIDVAPKAASGARVYNSANISIAHNTSTLLTFNSERYDTDAYHSTSSNTGRLTAPADGVYLITAQVYFAANAAGYRQVSISVNGTFIALEVIGAVTVASTATVVTLTTQYSMTAGQYAEAYVLQTSGGDLNVVRSNAFSPEFMITRIGD